MTSLKESVKTLLQNADREPIEDDKGLFGTVDRWADDYIKEFEEHMQQWKPVNPEGEDSFMRGYAHAMIEMSRFLRE